MEPQDLVKTEAQTLLDKVGLEGTVEAQEDKENNALIVNVALTNEDDNALLIGYHGANLNSFQTVLGAIVSRKSGDFVRVLVEVGGYRKEREQDLKRIAGEAADKARFLLKEVHLPPAPAYDRRVVHLHIESEKDVFSESRGERAERHVVVIPESLRVRAESSESKE